MNLYVAVIKLPTGELVSPIKAELKREVLLDKVYDYMRDEDYSYYIRCRTVDALRAISTYTIMHEDETETSITILNVEYDEQS